MDGRLKNEVRKILNYFFRGNNLLWVQIKSDIFHDNTIRVGASTNLSNVKISMAGGGQFSANWRTLFFVWCGYFYEW